MRLAILILLAAVLAMGAAPVRIIFDTDMGNDIDDAIALAMLHAFESRGEAKILAVTLTKDNKYAAPYVDLVNHFYGRPSIPVGVVKRGMTPEDAPMIRVPVDRGAAVYPRNIDDGTKAPDALQLLKTVLSKEKDGAVTIVQVGFFTNLARLLDEPGARALIERKVKLLVLMAGDFVSGKPEYNVKIDIPSAKKVFTEWPTPVVTSGFEIGNRILFPAKAIEERFGYVQFHPVADAYRAYQKMPYERPTWDPTALYYAVRPGDAFGVSPAGKITVNSEGVTSFQATTSGKHRYLTVDDKGAGRALAQFIELASQKPRQDKIGRNGERK